MMDETIKILLVDDIAENLVALTALLGRDGIELLTACSGREALELLLVHDISLAVLDVQMPEMDGLELAELMRGAARTRHVPIIFVTAGSHDQKRLFEGYDAGAVDFLYKPIDPHVLRGKIDVFVELARQRQRLAEALRLNEIFVGILGHDLRSPLGAMMTGAELLNTKAADPGQRDTLRRMTAAGRRMSEMIDQLLDLTRTRLGGGLGLVRTWKRVDLHECLRAAIDELRTSHPDREIVVETAGDAATAGDRDRLLQLLANLLANALEHGRPGAPVRAILTASARDIAIAIANAGAIPADVLPTVFEPFRRRARGAPRSNGLGLGLYIARQIAIAHGGDIAVESTPESGTVFTVRVPRGDAAEPALHAAPTLRP